MIPAATKKTIDIPIIDSHVFAGSDLFPGAETMFP